MKATVLLFNINEKVRLRTIASTLLPLGFQVKKVNREDYLQSIGYLAGSKSINSIEGIYDGSELEDEMIVMAGMGSHDIDRLIMAFRKAKLTPVNYKAMLTETNQYWDVLQLYKELEKEHEAMKKSID
ncbi:MAG: DUF3783 domain-containing protein [Mobilitalea sp.]